MADATINTDGKTKLEEDARLAREEMLRYNNQFGTYSKGSPSLDDREVEQYGANHTNAKSDGPKRATQPDEIDKGKGTRIYDSLKQGDIDTENGGSSTDIYGVTDILNTGRLGQIKNNFYKKDKAYSFPGYTGAKPTDIKVDTSKNKGQFKIK